MSNNWTNEQKQAIYEKGTNLLVAAAAGSGKTAVLVERIINKITNENVDIDKILVVTFTNAAATEMRERILNAIYKRIEEEPENEKLQRQLLLLNKANISTIHSFCLDVIKNNFYNINISPNFRLANTAEIELLKIQVLDEIFENYYEEKNEKFIDLVNIYGGYRDDADLKELILKIFKFIQSNPFPEEWLEAQVEKFNLKNLLDEDFATTMWGQILIMNFKEKIQSSINTLDALNMKLKQHIDLNKFYLCILDDVENLTELLKLNNWDDIYLALNSFKFKTWPIDKKVTIDLKDKAKETRDTVKKEINKYKEKIFIYNSKNAKEDIYAMYETLKTIKNIINSFTKKFQEEKILKNIIDFNDIEHFALNILVKKNENSYIPTDVAKKYQEKFEEIAIDEYQDSNLVQEYILSMISKGNNIFMVGDVKQSIYKFRQARPELFLEKYNNYLNIENNSGIGRKIKLFKNFRSRKNILDLTNIVFQNIMSKDIGDIDYAEDEFLNQGLEYENTSLNVGGKAHLNIIDLAMDDYNEENNEQKIIEDIQIEARFVAKEIKNILDGSSYVWDKNQGYRKVEFKDIAVLLRTTKEIANVFEKEISKYGYPVFCDTTNNYFESLEIQTILNLLKVVDNPMQDIPLVSVLRSPIIGITDNELVEIRLEEKNTSFFEALCKVKQNTKNDILKVKIDYLFDLLEDLQEKQEYLKLDELIWDIYEKTGYYNYVSLMTDGDIKIANLKMLFEKAKEYQEGSFKGLYNFINFIDKITKAGSDMGAPKLIGENENVIRIMSIHKSKGLEFPIVFLSNTQKQFNMQDLNEPILLHQDLGLGPKYINCVRKIEYNTLAKETIKIKAQNEIQSEEIRLLYVALTRAKEKIIITGIRKNLKKDLESKKKLLECNRKKIGIDKDIISKCKSYLDYFELVAEKDDRFKNIVDIKYYNVNDIKIEEEKNNNEFSLSNMEKIDKDIKNKLTWVYPRDILTKTEGKNSASKICKENTVKYFVEPIKLKDSDKKVINGAELGTIIHLVLQNLNFNENYDLNKIDELLKRLELKRIITNKQIEAVPRETILNFTKSEIFNKVKNSKKFFKEKSFYMNIPVTENENKDNILVQGIIDLFFIDNDENIILVDYKTDYVKGKSEEYLINKYKKQLELYKKALEQALNKHVYKTYIYSTYLNKEIEII